jgi:hypothetical protein
MIPGGLDRTKLLPKSGIGVVPPWLVIAPPENPPIRLDLRMLDWIRVGTGAEPDESEIEDGHDPRCDLILACEGLEVAIYVADGPEAVEGVIRDAAPCTREAGHATAVALEEVLIVGADPVLQRGDYIQIGSLAFRIDEVTEYAMHGANLPLSGGRLIQAAMALLVVAAARRETDTCTIP